MQNMLAYKTKRRSKRRGEGGGRGDLEESKFGKFSEKIVLINVSVLKHF